MRGKRSITTEDVFGKLVLVQLGVNSSMVYTVKAFP